MKGKRARSSQGTSAKATVRSKAKKSCLNQRESGDSCEEGSTFCGLQNGVDETLCTGDASTKEPVVSFKGEVANGTEPSGTGETVANAGLAKMEYTIIFNTTAAMSEGAMVANNSNAPINGGFKEDMFMSVYAFMKSEIPNAAVRVTRNKRLEVVVHSTEELEIVRGMKTMAGIPVVGFVPRRISLWGSISGVNPQLSEDNIKCLLKGQGVAQVRRLVYTAEYREYRHPRSEAKHLKG